MKLKFLKFCSLFNRFFLRLKHVSIHSSVFITGRIFVKKMKGATIVIEENCVLHGWRYLNPVFHFRPTLDACSSSARIILHKGVGLSGATIIASTTVEVGENTMLGADCLILDNDLHYPNTDWSWGGTYRTDQGGKPILIGKGCFIGARSIIMKGVCIGDGSVVAAGALVTRNVPPFHLAIGNPAQVKPLPKHLIHEDCYRKYHLQSFES